MLLAHMSAIAESITLDASKRLSINPTSSDAKTTIGGVVLFRGNSSTKSEPAMAIAGNAVSLDAASVRVGASGLTTEMSIESAQITIGEPEVNGSLVTGSVEITSAKIDIGAEGTSEAARIAPGAHTERPVGVARLCCCCARSVGKD